MNKLILLVLIMLLLLSVGCAIPQGATTAIGAAYDGNQAVKQAVNLYQKAAIRSLGESRDFQIKLVKNIYENQAKKGKVELTTVIQGLEKLLKNLNIIDGRKDSLVKLYDKTMQTLLYSDEALNMANDLVVRSNMNAAKLRELIDKFQEQQFGVKETP